MITIAIEGHSDEGAITRIVSDLGGVVTATYGKGGKSKLLKSLDGYAKAAEFSPWVAVVDLDTDFDCQVEARHAWLPGEYPGFVFAVAVNEIESWLLADPRSMSSYLGVSLDLASRARESTDAKESLLALAARSRRRDIREDIVAIDKNGTLSCGPLYASRVNEFALEQWEWKAAAGESESLQYFSRRTSELIDGCRHP